MPLYQTNDYMLLQKKEKNFIDKFKPKLNKTCIIHTHTNGNIYIYIQKNLKKHIRTPRGIITISEIGNHSKHTHTQLIKYQK